MAAKPPRRRQVRTHRIVHPFWGVGNDATFFGRVCDERACSTVVARRVKMRALGAMGAAATLPGDRITDSTLPGA